MYASVVIPDPASHEEEFANFYFPGNKFDKLEEILPGLAEVRHPYNAVGRNALTVLWGLI